MSTVNQCFFTDKALYIVIWNLALGEEAVANLQFWLLSIEVGAKLSKVLTVLLCGQFRRPPIDHNT